MNLDDLLNEMSEKMRNRDLSDEYLREHNNSTREEIGIGEYAYGITMIPCKWVYEYLSDYKRVLKENEKRMHDNITLKNFISALFNDSFEKDYIPVQKIKDKIRKNEEIIDISNDGDLIHELCKENKVLQELLESEE
uniref:Uncharacterized protein n=1 Tax=Myoviridae sp. ct2Pw37 TaxID=2825021 RepID=A0A8S5P9D6_9CAUD|nr:MAG TPA: hypothetical protein [Myoviridae sp. ct2Pw37]